MIDDKQKSDAKVTEQRVTRTVIRRRAGAIPPTPEVVEPPIIPKAPPSEPIKVEAPVKPVVQEKETEETEGKSKYRRIRIVTTQASTVQGPTVVKSAPPTPETGGVASTPEPLLPAPRAIGLGRKEIIEIR